MEPRISTTLMDHLSGRGLYALSQIIQKTCTFQITNLDHLLDALNSGRTLIFTGWHGMTMMGVPLIQRYHPDLSQFVVLMPDDWRGASLQVWTETMGGTPHPMNLSGDSTMAMGRQLLRLTRRVMGGKSLLINPDGPAGPSQVIKPGITFMARKAEAMIVPIGAYARRAYVVPRWDRYMVPYPFARISYHVGEPIDSLPEDDAAATELITNTLNRITLQAAADYYETGKAGQ